MSVLPGKTQRRSWCIPPSLRPCGSSQNHALTPADFGRRWQAKTESGATTILELLADDPELGGGKVQPLPTEGNISALNIPHSSMVLDHHETKEISADLLGDECNATEPYGTRTSSASFV